MILSLPDINKRNFFLSCVYKCTISSLKESSTLSLCSFFPSRNVDMRVKAEAATLVHEMEPTY